MKRRDFIASAAVGTVAAGTLAAPAIAQANPEIRWRLSSSFPRSLDTIWGASELIARRVAAITDNKFVITPSPAGEIVPPLQVLDAVQAGTIEMGHSASYYYFGKDPGFAFDTAMPFGLNARQQNAWMYHGNGRQLMAPLFAEYNVHAIPAGNTGAQMGGWFRREIRNVEDLRGLKMRIGGLAGRVLAKVGVVAQQLGAPDIYPALERGTIDAAEWVGPYDDERLGFNRVAQFYYYPGWWEGGPQLSTYVNMAKWNELPATYKAALEAACAEANVDMPAKYDALNPAALRRLVANGAQLRPFSREVMIACYRAAQETYTELSAASPHFRRIYEGWNAFRQEQYLWFRVAENTFDNFAFTAAQAAQR